ncbi:MAG: hypothetical protein L3J95_05895 [Thermoplasmata archaeon]|nr:hypothetical protein [Thermoplasmata archaeon]MCI4359929.1 hypothetical protein [Thermoplasmata archaeon]
MSQIEPSRAEPQAAPYASTRKGLFLPILAVLIMVLSGGAMLGVPSGHPGATPVAPRGGAAFLSPMTLQSGAQLQSDPVQAIAGAPLSNLPNATVLGPAPQNQQVWFTIGFPLRNQGELEQIISEQQLPGSPLYHHWLTTAQEQVMFGPPSAEVQDTVNYFTSLGMQVGTYGPLSVSFHAPTSLVSTAFHTTLSMVRYHNTTQSKTTIANSAPLSLPRPIASGISSIDGLSGPGNYRYYHSIDPSLAQSIYQAEAAQAGVQPASGPGIAPIVYNATMAELYNYTDQAFAWFSFQRPYHTQVLTSRYQSISAATFNQLFQANPLLAQGYNGNSTGKPITIAIVMEGGINPGDLQAYSQLVYNNPNQIVNRVTPDPIDGAYTWNGTLYYTDGGSGEMALDIEFSSTMAPGAHIIPVYSQGFFGNMLDDQYAALATMSPTPNIISNSWGGPEDEAGTLYTPGIGSDLLMHTYFMLLDAKGASILASSGDGGGFDPTTGILSGSFPATDPYVLSVDGLRSNAQDGYGKVFPGQNLTYGHLQTFIPLLNNFKPGLGVNVDFRVTKAQGLHNQSFWYHPISNLTLYSGPPTSSGGFGLSYWYQQPWYEHGIGVPNTGRSLGSAVAAEADFNMSIFFDGVPNFLYGGTSFACPTVAGEFADVADFLRAPGNGHSSYLGNLNVPVYEIGNMWANGNLTLPPYYDINNNGSSYWGSFGASQQYAWPPGQNFPVGPNGKSDYGTTLPGWDFPTGWGSINVYNFAQDMNVLENTKGFSTVNSTSFAAAPKLWFNMTLNQTYTIDVNTTASIAASSPVVWVEYFPQGLPEQKIKFSGGQLTLVASPSLGLRFTLNTGGAPFAPSYSPGLLIFTLGNASDKSIGFAYDWLNPAIPPGALTVTVLNPGSGSITGGCASANLDNPLGALIPPLVQSGLSCSAFSQWTGGQSNVGVLYENTFAVKVTSAAGVPVYNAVVTATVPQLTDLAWVGSHAELESSYYGRSADQPTRVISVTFTNVSGVALVQTWNMAFAAPYFVNATYGPETGGTIYTVVPAPSVTPIGVDNGKYAEFNALDLELYVYRASYNAATQNIWIQNYVNTSSLYNTLYAWQGQVMSFHVNNWTGSSVPFRQVWLGRYDTGQEYKFARYQPTGGVLGVTNSTGTTGMTDANGNVTLTVPDNMSDTNYFDHIIPAPLGLGAIAVDLPGVSNQSFNYVEPCAPINRSNPNLIIHCEYNNSYMRNYTATPMWILPNPVNLTTMTPNRVPRDFFGSGTPVSFLVNVSLPNADPLSLFYFVPNGYNGNPIQWSSTLEHITGVNAFVDGHFAANITPEEPPMIQLWASFINLTANYTPGIHYLTVYVNTSMGQTFSFTHEFVIGSITNENLNQNDLYTPIPYNLNWSIDLGTAGGQRISNLTFNSSLEVTYLGTGCPSAGCVVVNYSVKVHPGQVNYHQSINMTFLEQKGFYADAPELPTQSNYAVTIWFSANHSGSLRQGVTTNFIFDPLGANITGPASSASVPLGNVTIAYTYQGDYLNTATLLVYQNQSDGTPSVLVYSQLAFVPAQGGQSRSGSATWAAVTSGNYWIELVIGNPFSSLKRGEPVVVPPSQTTIIKSHSGANPLFGNALADATALVLIAAIVGILLGLWVAPSLRRETPVGPGAAGPAKPWEEGKEDTKSAVASKNECSICHERFETATGLQQHQRVVHGVEE